MAVHQYPSILSWLSLAVLGVEEIQIMTGERGIVSNGAESAPTELLTETTRGAVVEARQQSGFPAVAFAAS